MVHLITYDLHKPDRDYKDVIAAIKRLGSATEVAESVWLVDTTKATDRCRDALKEASEDATYFVVRARADWASFKIGSAPVTWLKDASRSW